MKRGDMIVFGEHSESSDIREVACMAQIVDVRTTESIVCNNLMTLTMMTISKCLLIPRLLILLSRKGFH